MLSFSMLGSMSSSSSSSTLSCSEGESPRLSLGRSKELFLLECLCDVVVIIIMLSSLTWWSIGEEEETWLVKGLTTETNCCCCCLKILAGLEYENDCSMSVWVPFSSVKTFMSVFSSSSSVWTARDRNSLMWGWRCCLCWVILSSSSSLLRSWSCLLSVSINSRSRFLWFLYSPQTVLREDMVSSSSWIRRTLDDGWSTDAEEETIEEMRASFSSTLFRHLLTSWTTWLNFFWSKSRLDSKEAMFESFFRHEEHTWFFEGEDTLCCCLSIWLIVG